MDEDARDPKPDPTRNLNDALALLAPYESLLLAVSGGPDSVALMLACARWTERRHHHFAVATVDHGLRAEAGAEAEAVASWAGAFGFPHRLLRWDGEKPTSRLQELARDARYALLADCAKRIGATAIVTAHHADDQAETILFRLTRGSGVAGLAGMAAVTACHGVALLRPLLSYPKRDLVEICAYENHPFFEDPSNESERFARSKLRKLTPLLANQGLDREALLRLGARAAQADAALTHYARETFERAQLNANAQLMLDAQMLRSAPREILQRVIALALQHVLPGAAPRLERLERASLRIAQALETDSDLRLTLADVLIDATTKQLTLRVAPPRKLHG